MDEAAAVVASIAATTEEVINMAQLKINSLEVVGEVAALTIEDGIGSMLK